MNESQVSVPLSVRLRFGHAAVQHLADEIGVDLLHIKGVAVDPRLRPMTHRGSDVDVLVRPEHVAAARPSAATARVAPLQHLRVRLAVRPRADLPARRVGIRRHPPFLPRHPRRRPDARSSDVWADRATISIAGVGCPVPSVPAQAVLLMLNAARSRADRQDVEVVWREA